jgi:hypothetical protein
LKKKTRRRSHVGGATGIEPSQIRNCLQRS